MNRIKQPSTWAGLAGLLLVAKVVLPAYGAIFDGLAAAASAAAVGLNEGGQGDAS